MVSLSSSVSEGIILDEPRPQSVLKDQGPGALADGEEAPAHPSGEPGSTSQVLPRAARGPAPGVKVLRNRASGNVFLNLPALDLRAKCSL